MEKKTIKCLDKGHVTLLDVMGDDQAIVDAARTSIAGKGVKAVAPNEGLIRYLLRNRHSTPFEMCLHGDTRIPTMYREGVTAKTYTIRELADAFEKGGRENSWAKLVHIRTVNEDGSIVPTKIKRAWRTGKRQVFCVTEDSLLRRQIIVTDNHPFKTPSGYRSIQELDVGSELYLNGSHETASELWQKGHTIKTIASTLGVSTYKAYRSLKSAGVDTSRRSGFSRKEAGKHSDPHTIARRVRPILTTSTCDVSGDTPSEIHHLDEDPHNNNIDNLAHVTRDVHKALHNESYFPNRVYTRRIASIEPLGEVDVYDLEVIHDNHNFVAEGFVVHNCEFKFEMKMPIFVARQFIRHRTANVNEMSGRYSEMPEEYYVPETENIKFQATKNKQGRDDDVLPGADNIRTDFETEAAMSFTSYRNYLELGMARELARINLPLSTYTQWVWKCDLHNIMNLLSLRMHPHAQWEIRVFAEAMAELIKPYVPLAWKAFEDYRLNGLFLTHPEVETLRNFISSAFGSGAGDVPSDSLFPTTREYSEFLGKLSRLGLEAE